MIVYYVHHHGSGHARRAAVLARACATPVVGISSRAAPDGWPGEWVRIPGDADGVDPGAGPDVHDVTAGGTLHWVPRRHAGLRARTAALSAVLARPGVRLLVADVSVEVALLARLHGVPVAVVAQPGDRADRAHRTAYDLADRVLAPWPADGPPGSARTVHVGAFSRFDGRPAPAPPPDRRVLVLGGSGGSEGSRAGVRAAAAATPGWTWEVAGPPAAPDGAADPPNLRRAGWVGDVWAALGRARVVVGHAGLNAVAEIAAARRAAVVVPEERPYGEQRATARILGAAGLAVVADRWPEPRTWPGLLDHADHLGGDGWTRWSDGHGGARAAAVLDALAAAP